MRHLMWVALLCACAPGQRYDQAVAILIDVSGTYADKKSETVDLIKKQILPGMVPGDTVFVIRIGPPRPTRRSSPWHRSSTRSRSGARTPGTRTSRVP